MGGYDERHTCDIPDTYDLMSRTGGRVRAIVKVRLVLSCVELSYLPMRGYYSPVPSANKSLLDPKVLLLSAFIGGEMKLSQS